MAETIFNPCWPAMKNEGEIFEVDPHELTLCRWNPRSREGAADSDLEELTDSIRRNGQLMPAIVMRCADGRLELIAGSRRCAVAIKLGLKLRVEIRTNLSAANAFSIAQAENEGRENVSLWERASIYTEALKEGLFDNDLDLAQTIGVDKSTVSRTMSLARAPTEILDLFADKREITSRQWWAFAPFLNKPTELDRILDRAALLASKPKMPATLIFSSLTQAALASAVPESAAVLNEHGRRIAQIRSNANGGLSISIASMRELHPDQRRDWMKIVTRELADYVARVSKA